MFNKRSNVCLDNINILSELNKKLYIRLNNGKDYMQNIKVLLKSHDANKNSIDMLIERT